MVKLLLKRDSPATRLFVMFWHQFRPSSTGKGKVRAQGCSCKLTLEERAGKQQGGFFGLALECTALVEAQGRGPPAVLT